MWFPNPPIAEAIFDIKVNLSDEVGIEKLLLFQEKVGQEYPGIRQQLEFSSNFEIEAKLPPIIKALSTNKSTGYLFISNDEKRFAQVQLDGFTFSRIKPYETWEIFYKEAYKLWQFYVEVTTPKEVTRVALRYVNRISIPFKERVNLQDYIKTFPEIPETLPVTMIDYFMRLVVIHPDYTQIIGIISQTIEKNSEPVVEEADIPLIFDIDVFQETSLTPDDPEITNIFENKLRRFKNEIFCKSITENTYKLFQ